MRFLYHCLIALLLFPASVHAADYADVSRLSCRCWDGSPCLCGPECDCPNCPVHGFHPAKAAAEKQEIKTIPGHRALVFTASWCGPCKPAKTAREKAGLKEGVDYDLIDIDKDPDVMRKYSVTQIPYLVLLDGEKVHLRLLGVNGQADEIKGWMRQTEKPKQAVHHVHGGHTHRCDFCGHLWSHENFNYGNPAAHGCPNCGRITMGNRTEGWTAPVIHVQRGYWVRQCGAGGCRNVWVSF